MTTPLSSTLPTGGIRITTDAATEPYWQAAKARRLVAPRCTACGAFRFPPGPFCPECRSQDVDWVNISAGTVFSFSIVRHLPGMKDLVLVPVVVEFPEAPGVHIVSNIIDIDPDDVHIGMIVEPDFVDIADNWKLPVFRGPRAACDSTDQLPAVPEKEST